MEGFAASHGRTGVLHVGPVELTRPNEKRPGNTCLRVVASDREVPVKHWDGFDQSVVETHTCQHKLVRFCKFCVLHCTVFDESTASRCRSQTKERSHPTECTGKAVSHMRRLGELWWKGVHRLDGHADVPAHVPFAPLALGFRHLPGRWHLSAPAIHEPHACGSVRLYRTHRSGVTRARTHLHQQRSVGERDVPAPRRHHPNFKVDVHVCLRSRQAHKQMPESVHSEREVVGSVLRQRLLERAAAEATAVAAEVAAATGQPSTNSIPPVPRPNKHWTAPRCK
jgi:hypothetical protein